MRRKSQIENRKSKFNQRVTAVTDPGYDEAQTAARYITEQAKMQPRVGIILGSGLGEVVSRLEPTSPPL